MLENRKIKIFADGASLPEMLELRNHRLVRGFTTNPTLMRQAGVTDYESFAREVLDAIKDLPVSFEVFADDLENMKRQALMIAKWGENVNVKIPIMTTKGELTLPIIKSLSDCGVHLNVTALMTTDQVRSVMRNIPKSGRCLISVFAGRIADTGVDPVPVMRECLDILAENHSNAELLWASPREVFNIFEADKIGCHVITVSNNLLMKLNNLGKDLEEFSRETVQMFYDDATRAGFSI